MSNLKTSRFRIDAFAGTAFALLALYAVLLLTHATDVAGGADSAGYLTSARLLTQGELTIPARTIPELPADDMWPYTPLGMIATADQTLRPTYPVGLPLHFAAAASVAGWTWGPKLVTVLGAIGAIVFTYLCARELGVRRSLAATAAACLGLSAVLIFSSIQPLSDTLSLAWNAAAFACALRARRERWFAWSAACGAAVAMAVLVRPTDALIIPSLCLVLWHWRRLLGAFVGGLPGALFLLWYNKALYGSPFVTGYGSIQGMISAAWVGATLPMYAAWLPRLLPIGVLALLVAPWLPWRSAWRELLALGLWFAAFAGFYAFYSCTHEVWWYMRFILPAFTAPAVAAALGCERMASLPAANRSAWPRILLVALPLLVTAWINRDILKRQGVWNMADEQRPYKELSLWARDHLPADAVVFTLHASCSLYFYSDLAVIRSDIIKPERFVPLRERLHASGRPAYALLNKYEDESRRQEQIPGDWEEIHRIGNFSLWRLRPTP